MVFARGITEMSNSREAFEMWAAFELMEHDFEMGEHGEYLDDFLQQSWLGWNAARAQDGGEVEPFGAESAYQTAKKSILTGSNMIISCDLVRELVEALRNSESQQPSTVVQESAACVSPAPHYETQRGLSCKSDTKSTVVPEWVSVDENLPIDVGQVLMIFGEPLFGTCNPTIETGYYDKESETWRFWTFDREVRGFGVTHWMKLPEPPKQDPLN
jgi:hypothetical protein